MPSPWESGCLAPCEKGFAAWDFIKASQVISRVPCELVGVFVTCGVIPKFETCTVEVFNGTNAQSPKITDLRGQNNRTIPFLPPEPILCDRGLYLVLNKNVTSVALKWRPLPAGWRP